MTTIAATSGNATWLGLWADLTSPQVCRCVLTQGSSVALQFTGTSLALGLWVPTQSYPTEIEWSIDGGAFQPVRNGSSTHPISDGMVLASGLANGTHTAQIRLAGAYFQDSRWTNHYGLGVKSFIVDTACTVSSWPTGNPAWVFGCGDSFMAANLVLGGTSTPDLPQYASGRLSFMQVLGTILGVDVVTFANGGAGIGESYGSTAWPEMDTAFGYAMDGISATWPSTPPLFVLNELVNNDGGDTQAAFIAAYKALLTKNNTQWPGVPIFCVTTMGFTAAHNADIATAVAWGVSNGINARVIDATAWSGLYPYPNNGHPDTTRQALIASDLAATITTSLTASALGTAQASATVVPAVVVPVSWETGMVVGAQGTSDAEATIVGALTVPVSWDVNADASLVASASGAASVGVTLTQAQALLVAAQGAGLAQAALTLQEAISGAATGSGTVTVSPTLIQQIIAATTGQGGATATFTMPQALQAQAIGAGAASALVTLVENIVSAAAGLGSAHASITLGGGTHEVYRVGIGATITVTDAAGGVVTEYLPEGGVVSCSN